MSLIGFVTTNYKEERKPAEDAASVGRWIIGPAILASFLGAAMFGGIAGMSQFDGGWFVFWALSFGGGFMGLLMMFTRILTYDKRPYVHIRETTQEPVREEALKQEPMRGNAAPTYTQPNGSVIVEDEVNGRYEFTRKQMKAMYDRLDANNYQVARDAFGITPADYPTVCALMSRAGYWKVWQRNGTINRVELLEDGADWLRAKAR